MPRHDESHRVHIPLVAHIRRRAVPGLVWFHPANGAYYANARQGAFMGALGVRPGVSDLIFLHKGQLYALELKRLKGGRATAEQMQFLADVERAGGVVAIAAGLDEALAKLEQWGLVYGATQFAMALPFPDPIRAKKPRATRSAKAAPRPTTS